MKFLFFFCRRRRLFSFHFSRLRSLHLHRCLVEFEHGSFVRWSVLILSFPSFFPSSFLILRGVCHNLLSECKSLCPALVTWGLGGVVVIQYLD